MVIDVRTKWMFNIHNASKKTNQNTPPDYKSFFQFDLPNTTANKI